MLYPFPNQIELVTKIHERFGDEVLCHLEFVRFDGKVTCFGLPLVRFTTEERLDEIMAIHEDMGAPDLQPPPLHAGGGRHEADRRRPARLQAREADPQGLLNPGKMIAWEDPSYDFTSGKTFLFPRPGGAVRMVGTAAAPTSPRRGRSTDRKDGGWGAETGSSHPAFAPSGPLRGPTFPAGR